jgi:hypothetical protein
MYLNASLNKSTYPLLQVYLKNINLFFRNGSKGFTETLYFMNVASIGILKQCICCSSDFKLLSNLKNNFFDNFYFQNRIII